MIKNIVHKYQAYSWQSFTKVERPVLKHVCSHIWVGRHFSKGTSSALSALAAAHSQYSQSYTIHWRLPRSVSQMSHAYAREVFFSLVQCQPFIFQWRMWAWNTLNFFLQFNYNFRTNWYMYIMKLYTQSRYSMPHVDVPDHLLSMVSKDPSAEQLC